MGGASSAGALRIERSCRFFDTALSLNDEDFFESLLRREKLSVCDLLTFRPNILSRFGGRG